MPLAQLNGELIRFSYQAESGAFAVGSLRSNRSTVTVVGPIGHAVPGQHLRLNGQWVEHPIFGRQFKATSLLIDDPKSREGIERYLAKGIKGLGPTYAKRIVARFGLEALDILNKAPESLLDVQGIGKKRMETIRDQWRQDQEKHVIRAGLLALDLGPVMIERLLERYGQDAMAITKREPYRLAREIRGIGFKSADEIARRQGMASDAPERARAALLHILREAEGQGHCHCHFGDVFAQAERMNIPLQRMEEAIAHLKGTEITLPIEAPDQIHRIAMWGAENRVAHRIRDACQGKRAQKSLKLLAKSPIAMEALQRQLKLDLNLEQRKAIETALSRDCCIVTGGPGTGKTTIIRALLLAAQSRGEEWLLAAPTGRAAKRMTESTGFESKTIHRLLNYNGMTRRFKANAENPLAADAVLIDEASMIDIWLMDSLLKAMPEGCKLILIGDADQLPSVGPGRVLGDLIDSEIVEVCRLKSVYRQAKDANIVRNAHRINGGENPISVEKDTRASKARDFFIIEREDSAQTTKTLIQIIKERLPKLGFDPMKSVQILTPMRGGPLGTEALNAALQNALNPNLRAQGFNVLAFRVGDRVMQSKNDHENEVYNGDIGHVEQADDDGVVVNFDGRRLRRTKSQASELELAYAITIHKSQGSEYPAVITLVARSHQIMLQRNLLYTAVTRAKQFCCLLGSKPAIQDAVGRRREKSRKTMLTALLKGN